MTSRSPQQLRLRTLEQYEPGGRVRRQWHQNTSGNSHRQSTQGGSHSFRSNHAANRTGGRSGHVSLPALAVDLQHFYSTKKLDRLRRVVTGSTLHIGEGIVNHDVVYAAPLNEKKPLQLNRRQRRRSARASQLPVSPIRSARNGRQQQRGRNRNRLDDDAVQAQYYDAVSYTHLTLPTIYSV